MEEYKEYIKFASLVLEENQNWMDFKKIMLKSIPPRMRKNFSTRDPKTKKQSLNSFEREIIDIYYGETGVKLKLEINHD
tara:strand:- start:411 stop:647 length:237 start_codon:yes stop_codon:yes gene_type:complete